MSASSPKRASLITSSRVSQVLGRPSLLYPCSHLLSRFPQHSTASPLQVERMFSMSVSLNFRILPICFHRGARSSMMYILCCTPCSSLYLKQVSVARSRVCPTNTNNNNAMRVTQQFTSYAVVPSLLCGVGGEGLLSAAATSASVRGGDTPIQ